MTTRDLLAFGFPGFTTSFVSLDPDRPPESARRTESSRLTISHDAILLATGGSTHVRDGRKRHVSFNQRVGVAILTALDQVNNP